MSSLKGDFLEGLTFSADQLKTIRAIGDARGQQALWYQQVPETLKSLRRRAIIESSESSNRLEGVTVQPGRLRPLIEERDDPHDRSEQEIAGYRDALALVHESGRDMSFTPNVIRQVHGRLYRYMADEGGEWKGAPNDIIERLPDGSEHVRFQPTPPHLVAPQMEAVCEQYRMAQGAAREPLVLIPLAILDFLCIHPFRDGNGRVARLLTLMLLYQASYEVGRFISLERVIEESKETYYEALERSSQGWHEGRHDVMPWLDYFWGMLLRAYSEFEERLERATAGGLGSKAERVRAAVLRRSEPFRLAEIHEECEEVSRETVRNVLRKMRDEDLVRSTGTGRGAQWQRNQTGRKDG